jgi:hypothetical protein
MICFCTYVYGWYEEFIPIFLYSLLSTQKCHIKIFVEKTVSTKIKSLLSTITGNYEIVENFGNPYGIPHLAANRFLLNDFKEFDYVYFTDIDFIFYQHHNFCEYYLNHCDSTGLPFSNSWNYEYGIYRMTGLHFIKTKPYYELMSEQIESMRLTDNNFRIWCNHNNDFPSYDEEMLYYMITQVFDIRSLHGYARPFPGIHLGEFRVRNSFIRQNFRKFTGAHAIEIWKKDIQLIQNITNTSTFREIIQQLPMLHSLIRNMNEVLNYKLY